MIYFLTIALFFLILIVNAIIKKKKLLPNYTGEYTSKICWKTNNSLIWRYIYCKCFSYNVL